MSSFLTILNAVVPVFLVIAAGFVARKAKWVLPEADVSFTRLVLYLLYPCLVLHSLIGNKSLIHPGSVCLAAALGFGSMSIGAAIAAFFAGFAGKESAARRTFTLSAGCQNYAYIPVPLAMALFDKDTVGMIFVFSFGFDIAFWTVGISILRGGLKAESLRHLANPGLVSVIAGVLLNALGAEAWLPSVILSLFGWLGNCCIPLSLLLVGLTLADYAGDFRPGVALRVVTAGVFVRIFLLGGLLLAAAKFIPMPINLRHIMILQAAMPAAIFPIIAAKHYGGDPLIAIKVVFGTSLVCLISAPLLIDFALRAIH